MKGRSPPRPELHSHNELRHTTLASSNMSLTEMLWVEEPTSLSYLDFHTSVFRFSSTGELSTLDCKSQAVMKLAFILKSWLHVLFVLLQVFNHRPRLEISNWIFQSFAHYRTAAYLLIPLPPHQLATMQYFWLWTILSNGSRVFVLSAVLPQLQRKDPGEIHQQKGELTKKDKPENHKEHRRTGGTGTGNTWTKTGWRQEDARKGNWTHNEWGNSTGMNTN